MILKEVIVELTQEEVDSPEEIKIHLVVKVKDDPDDESVGYTITYPKGK